MYPGDFSVGSDPKKIRNYNRMLILDLIRREGIISKAGISRKTGISFSTVGRVIDELISENLIKSSQDKQERGSGRPGELFEFDGKSHFVIGADLGYPNIRGFIADLSGEIHKEITFPVDTGNGVENYQRLLQLLNQLQQEDGIQIPSIYGVGLGIAGIVDHTSGVVVQSSILGWDNFPLARRLHQATGLPIFLDNDINLITFGEYGFGIGKGSTNMACITLGTRVLCGLILHGEIFRGSNLNSGRLDQFIPLIDQPKNTITGSIITLDSYVSSISVLNKAREELAKLDTVQAQSLNEASNVYSAYNEGKPWAIETLEPVIRILAAAIANIFFLLDLEIMVISGRMAEESKLIIPSITTCLNGKIPSIPHIVASNLGSRATVLGAIMLVYRGLLRDW